MLLWSVIEIIDSSLRSDKEDLNDSGTLCCKFVQYSLVIFIIYIEHGNTSFLEYFVGELYAKIQHWS